MTPLEYEEARAYLKAKLASPKRERERWLNEIIDSWIASRRRPSSGKKKGKD